MTVVGGYPSGGGSTSDPDTNVTLLSGDIGTAGNITDNGTTGPFAHRGGLYVDNSAGIGVGAIASLATSNQNACAVMVNCCWLLGNFGTNYGGAIWNASKMSIYDSVFSGYYAASTGPSDLVNSVFWNDTDSGASTEIAPAGVSAHHCDIEGLAASAVSGYSNFDSDPVFVDVGANEIGPLTILFPGTGLALDLDIEVDGSAAGVGNTDAMQVPGATAAGPAAGHRPDPRRIGGLSALAGDRMVTPRGSELPTEHEHQFRVRRVVRSR